jgi:hypothetical protein
MIPGESFPDHEYYRQQQPALLELRHQVDRLLITGPVTYGIRSVFPVVANEHGTVPKRLNPLSLLELLSMPETEFNPQPTINTESEAYILQREINDEIGFALHGVRSYLWRRVQDSKQRWSHKAIDLSTTPTSARFSGVTRYVAELDYDISRVTLDISHPRGTSSNLHAGLYRTALYHTIVASKVNDVIETTNILSIDGRLRHIDSERFDGTKQQQEDGFSSFPSNEYIEDLTTDLSALH